MINSEKLKKILKAKKLEQVKTPYPYLGQSIKKRRLELSLTQAEVCDGICSISYLSKIENMRGDLGYLFIDQILARLKMNSNVYMLGNQRKIFCGILKGFVDDNKRVINGIIKKITKEEGTYIYSVGQYVKKINEGKLEQASEIFEYLISLKGFIGYEELYTFIALEFMNSVINGNIEDAYLLNELLTDNSMFANNIIEIFISKIRFEFYLKIEDFESARKYLNILCEYYTNTGNHNLYANDLFKLNFKKFDCGLEYNNGIRLSKEMNLYMLILKAIKRNDKKIIDKLDKIASSPNIDFAKVLACDHFDVNYEKYINLNNYKGEKKIIITSLKQKSISLNNYKTYLKHIAIPYAIKNGDKQLIKYFSTKLADEYTKKSRYKDAVKALKNIK